jgi:hypothetical protein
MKNQIVHVFFSVLLVSLVLAAPTWPDETLGVAVASVWAAVFGLGDKFLV